MRLLGQGFDALDQPLLAGALAFQRFGHELICATLDQQAVNDDRVLLPLAVQPCVALLVELQVPGETVPDQVVAACLEIEAVCAAGGLRQEHIDLRLFSRVSNSACKNSRSKSKP